MNIFLKTTLFGVPFFFPVSFHSQISHFGIRENVPGASPYQFYLDK